MAVRNGNPDLTTGLHTGPNRLGVAGLVDPNGNDWIVMNDTAVAPGGNVNAVQITTASSTVGPTISVGGINSNANSSLTIVGAGTGAVGIGSSVSAVNVGGSLGVSSAVTPFSASPSSAAIKAIQFGTNGPAIYFGSSAPTIACTVGSLFLNTGGSSTTGFFVCMPNGGSASSSNWDSYTPI